MKRPGQPEEVAPAFVFFASEADSSYISGDGAEAFMSYQGGALYWGGNGSVPFGHYVEKILCP